MDSLRKTPLRFGLVAISALLLVALVAVGIGKSLNDAPQASGIPQEVAGYRLLRSVEGPEALQLVAGMHQRSPQIINAWVAYYERGGTVWAGTTTSNDAATEQVEAMAQAIGKGGSPFSDLRAISLEGRRLFAVSDSISTNYFFQGSARVIWIIPPRDGGLPFVKAALGKL